MLLKFPYQLLVKIHWSWYMICVSLHPQKILWICICRRMHSQSAHLWHALVRIKIGSALCDVQLNAF